MVGANQQKNLFFIPIPSELGVPKQVLSVDAPRQHDVIGAGLDRA